MDNIQEVLTKYKRSSDDFITHVEAILHTAEIDKTQNDKDKTQIIKDRADLIAKSNALLAQVNSMRDDRDGAMIKVKEAEKLKESSEATFQKALIQTEKNREKEEELDERAKKYEDMEDKKKDLEKREQKFKDVENFSNSLKVKEEFIKREQDLLYEKQKSLEIRQNKIDTDEARLKRLHDV